MELGVSAWPRQSGQWSYPGAKFLLCECMVRMTSVLVIGRLKYSSRVNKLQAREGVDDVQTSDK